MRSASVKKALTGLVAVGAVAAGATAWYYHGSDACPIRKAMHAPGTVMISRNAPGTSGSCCHPGPEVINASNETADKTSCEGEETCTEENVTEKTTTAKTTDNPATPGAGG